MKTLFPRAGKAALCAVVLTAPLVSFQAVAALPQPTGESRQAALAG